MASWELCAGTLLQRVVAGDRVPRGPSREEDEEHVRCMQLSASISAARLLSDGFQMSKGGRYFIYRPPRDGKVNTVRSWFGPAGTFDDSHAVAASTANYPMT